VGVELSDVVIVVIWPVVVEGGLLPPLPLLESFTVTTLRAGRVTVTVPPESVAEVKENWWVLSVSHADAVPGVKLVKERVLDCWEVPLLVKTATTELSRFWNTPVRTPEIDPEMDNRWAPGRI
jgi:hypothetical protein